MEWGEGLVGQGRCEVAGRVRQGGVPREGVGGRDVVQPPVFVTAALALT